MGNPPPAPQTVPPGETRTMASLTTGPTKKKMDEVKRTLPPTHGRVTVVTTTSGQRIYRVRIMTEDVQGTITKGVWKLNPEQPYCSRAWFGLERAKRNRPVGLFIREYQRVLQEGGTICLNDGTGDPGHNVLLRLKCDLLHIVTPLSMGELSLTGGTILDDRWAAIPTPLRPFFQSEGGTSAPTTRCGGK